MIVVLSFAIFALDQTRSASTHQREQLAGAPVPLGTSHATRPHEAPLHRTIEDVAEGLTSPFSGIVADSSGEWAVRGVKLLLALLVYGFGLGYLARTLRVRV